MAAVQTKLFCIGNPLLDLQTTDDVEGTVMAKYDLKPGLQDLIAPDFKPTEEAKQLDHKREGLFDDIKQREHRFLPGGSAQNTARGAAYVLGEGKVVYCGSVGEDDDAISLRNANGREDVQSVYYVKKGGQTGKCGVVVVNDKERNRSLITKLNAAEQFDSAWLKSPEVVAHIDAASHFFIEGYFLTHGAESALHVAKTAHDAGKTVILTLSAPFIIAFFSAAWEPLFPYIDIVICNEDEALEWWNQFVATAEEKSAPAVTKGSSEFQARIQAAVLDIASYSPKSTTSDGQKTVTKENAKRISIVTQGSLPTIYSNSKTQPGVTNEVPVTPLKSLVDTNGAGDGFAGGFVGGIIAGKPLKAAIDIGHKLAGMVCQLDGPAYDLEQKKNFKEANL